MSFTKVRVVPLDPLGELALLAAGRGLGVRSHPSLGDIQLLILIESVELLVAVQAVDDAAVTLATAAAVADIGSAVSNYLASGFGAIDENRKGCLFPMLGWNHSYTFILDEPVITEDGTESTAITESVISQLSPTTEQKINEIKTQYGLQGTSTNLLLLGVLAPLLILALLPRSISKSKKSKPKEETSDE